MISVTVLKYDDVIKINVTLVTVFVFFERSYIHSCKVYLMAGYSILKKNRLVRVKDAAATMRKYTHRNCRCINPSISLTCKI